jgi:stearoyl-CoA desaturase (Delta-9 desaturase)
MYQFFALNVNKVTFVALHFLVLPVFFVPVCPLDVALFVGFYYLRMFGITAGYHRFLSHRAYKANRLFGFMLAWIGCSAMQKGPLWWSTNHRKHHKYSDQEGDPHSPVLTSFWQAHIGWIFKPEGTLDYSNVADLQKFWELRLLDRFHLVPGLCLLWLCWFLDGVSGMAWGFVVSTVCLYHGTFTVNSVCHLFGKRSFTKADWSRDNIWIAIFVTMGEGWHNCHHARQARARHGIFWWQLDFSYYLLWLASLFGCVKELYKPPPKMLPQGEADA